MAEFEGKILSHRGRIVTVELKDDDSLYKLEKYTAGYLHSVGIEVADKRSVSAQQRKFAMAIINDIARAQIGGAWAGIPNLVYEYFKFRYFYLTGDEDFSLSNARGVKSKANEFINMLLDFCLDHDVGLSRVPIQELQPEEIKHWEYACLMKHVCVLDGKPGDLHHLEGSRIGMGNNRLKVNHLGRMAISLCREHHSVFVHTKSEKAFLNKYHLSGIAIDETIAKSHHLKTTGGNDDRTY
ncbi:putative HNHc nuclease [Eupransor demetentiae]|uniref:HNH endonuclease n=1 Tax=Eupransor demetentiae TaxID=3109584 RepID=A0ABP0ESQ7_9LACO|nr:hypothetical protein R54876_GBNLAHCA_00702 [Lactobacillaceae bacterium LMG 33000]